MKRPTRRTVVFGAAGLASGLALAALLIPQLVDTVGPTALGLALLTVALTLLSTIGQRLDTLYSHRHALEDALCVWPPELLGDADPARLGVYPTRNRAGELDPYRRRHGSEDAALREGLRSGLNVIVHGPARSGKSRAACEAARRELPDVPVIVPAQGGGLATLIDSGIPRDAFGGRVCLWLDDLQRFIDDLDSRRLDRLAGIGDGVQIVATVRSEQWKDLIEGSGESTQAARSLAGNAREVRLSSARVRAADGEQDTQSIERSGDRRVVKPPPPLRDRGIAALAGVLAVTLVAILIAGVRQDLFKPPSIDSQMSAIKAELRRDAGPRGAHFVLDERLRLHPTEADSWIVVVEDGPSHDAFARRVEMCQTACRGPVPLSDEVRIYDVQGGRLHLELDFRPRGSGPIAEEWRKLPGAQTLAADYDQDNVPEIIAGYALPSRAYEAVLPFDIAWQSGRYALMSLTPQPPPLASRTLDAATTSFRHVVYLTPLTIRTGVRDSRFSGLQLTGYRAQAFALAQQPVLRLLTGYATSIPVSSRPVTLELRASQIRIGGTLTLEPCTTTYSACPAPKREQDVTVPPDRDWDFALLTAWGMVGSRWRGEIRVSSPAAARGRTPR